MRVIQINSLANSGSTGRIAEQIGQQIIAAGHESYIAFGRRSLPGTSELISLNDQKGQALHLLKTRLFDRHGFGSQGATRQLLGALDRLQPDIVHVHNLHGYYLHIGLLFEYLKAKQIPVVFTLHDCWTFTGHCSHFETAGCYKWQTECHQCPNVKKYPASWGLDQSTRNFRDKKRLLTGLENAVIVTPSNWLKKHVEASFLGEYPVQTIYNGIDLSVFNPSPSHEKEHFGVKKDKKIVLAVASVWTVSKGWNDLLDLRSMLPDTYEIVVVGVTEQQKAQLPSGMMGITRTENVRELASLYALSEVFLNLTYADNFPSTNIEALACGTPVITYNTGGSPEAVHEGAGFVVEKGDVKAVLDCINLIQHKSRDEWRLFCRKSATDHYAYQERCLDYLQVYNQMLEHEKP
jgi:putative colanic acid biosynthesis glycosyltransferase